MNDKKKYILFGILLAFVLFTSPKEVQANCPNTTNLNTAVQGVEPYIQLCHGLSFGESFVFERDKNLTIFLQAFNFDRTKATSTEAFITIRTPNGTVIANDLNMTFDNGGFFKFELNQSNVTNNGLHSVSVRAGDGNNFGFTEFNYFVSPSGFKLTTGQGILYIVVLFGSVLLLLALMWTAFKIPWSNVRDVEGNIFSINRLKYIRVLLLGISYLTLVMISNIMNNISQSFLFLDGAAAGLFEITYLTLLSATGPFFFTIFAFTIIVFLQDKKTQELLSRGINPK